jgi:hypothetical protein
VLEWLEGTELSSWIRTELWGWPLALTLHALGTAVVVGFVLIIGLRLFRLFELIPLSSLVRVFPIVWAGLALQVLTGFVLWMTRPTRYISDGAFVFKVLLIVLGTVLAVKVFGQIRREADLSQAGGAVSSRAAAMAAATLVVWCSVVIASRLTGYLGSIG